VSPRRAPRDNDPPQVGPYRIEAVLGQGGMGRVFLARDSRDEGAAPVALKVLSQTGDATARGRFRRELAAARRVEGIGTARVLDGDPSAEPPWLATEYIDGPTLDQLVAGRGALSASAAAGLAIGVAGALATIHAAGVVHRDLKPANIILAPDGPRVVDFGIARTADATTLSVAGLTMGTPGYMAPEQIEDPRGAGPAVDVFALGAVLVFATTGLSPYAGGDPATVIYRIVHGEPSLDGVPGEIRELVAWCLTRRPQGRPSPAAVAASGLSILDEFARRAELSAVLAERLEETVPEIAVPVIPVPASAVDLTVVTPKPQPQPRPEPEYERPAKPAADPIRTRRRTRRGLLAALVAFVVAALAATGWFSVQAFAHPLSPSASKSATARRGSASSTPSESSASAKAGPTVFPGGTVLAGPGCASSRWTVFSITSGSLETGVGGGDPDCGGLTDAFRKSGNSSESGASAEWAFDFRRAVTCTLRIYIANTNPSSGIAVYKLAVGADTDRFTINQADGKGQFVAAGALDDIDSPTGVIKLTLTDISALAGDQNHVTASAVSAACQLS
jgi:serine/threonine protein kinase